MMQQTPTTRLPPISATAFSPASVGNIGVGFDVLGHALEGLGDTVTVTRIAAPRTEITAIAGVVTDLPVDPLRNTAGRAVEALRQKLGLEYGLAIHIDKGIPLGSGLGGSAASASAALVAANAVTGNRLDLDALYPLAMEGEYAASGSHHGDNVGPQLYGGVVLALTDRCIRLPTPPGIVAVVVHPHFVLETRRARAALADPYAIGDFVRQSTLLAGFIAACYRQDLNLLRASLADVLVEPRRAALIPGFARVKQAALDHGALGASISGAGPSVFGWYTDPAAARAAGAAMRAAFADVGLDSDIAIGALDAPGARLVTPAPA